MFDSHFRSNPMDIKPSSATAAVPINSNPHTETDLLVLPTNPDLIKSSAFRSEKSHTNGQVDPLLLKHNHPLTAAVGYKECLKNHAAIRGGYALDGCGEFFRDPISELSDPTSLKCAACGCHRNFHRRSDSLNSSPRAFVSTPTFLLLPPPQSSPSCSTSPTTLSPHSPPPVSHVPPRSSFFGGAQIVLVNSTPLDETTTTKVMASDRTARKRSRTKFSGEQKEKMLGFAEKLGWRTERSKEGLVVEFCDQVGIGRNVFKVWMHNNKSRIINNNKQRFDSNNGEENCNKNEINVNDDDGQHQKFYLCNNDESNSSSS